MDIHYIIIAHTNPAQVKRLVERLQSAGVYFYIHIDRRAVIDDFQQLLPASEQVNYLPLEKRESCIWGGTGLIKAALSALEMIVQTKRRGYCVLMSGQDYPLRSNASIYSFLQQNHPREFMHYLPLPDSIWPGKGKNRIEQYKVDFSEKRGDFIVYPTIYHKDFYTLRSLKNLKKLVRTGKAATICRLFRHRKFPAYIRPFGGSLWWTITTEAAAKIMVFNQQHPDYLHYHRFTLSPDEIFFHSILLHLYKGEPERIAPTLTYVNWERKTKDNPAVFGENDYSELEQLPSHILFARKFNMLRDQRILDKLDRELRVNT